MSIMRLFMETCWAMAMAGQWANLTTYLAAIPVVVNAKEAVITAGPPTDKPAA